MRFGTKKVYLPNHVVTLLRNQHLPPTHASFHVPLTFTKLDLKDYLFHLYNVEVRAVRSWVKAKNRTRRLPTKDNQRPDKYMTVELVKPFVWPKEPEDLSPWDNEMYNAMSEWSKEQQSYNQSGERERAPGRRETLKEMVDRLKLAEEEAKA